MIGQVFQIQHLRAGCCQRLQQSAFAGTGCTAGDAPLKAGGQAFHIRQHLSPVSLVAAVQLPGAPADLRQHMRHRTAALSPAPAVDQRTPFLLHRRKMGVEMQADVARNQRRARSFGIEGRNLLVHGADARPFLVVQNRVIERAGDVVFSEFGRRADIDNVVKFRQLC